MSGLWSDNFLMDSRSRPFYPGNFILRRGSSPTIQTETFQAAGVRAVMLLNRRMLLWHCLFAIFFVVRVNFCSSLDCSYGAVYRPL